MNPFGGTLDAKIIAINFSFILIGALIPIMIEIIKGTNSNLQFRLRDVSTILSIVLAIYLVYYILYLLFSFSIETPFSYITFKLIISLIPLFAVLKMSPLKDVLNKLIYFPRIQRRSGSYVILVFFFVFTAAGVSMAVHNDSIKVLQGTQNLIMLRALKQQPFFSVSFIIIATFVSVVSEEVVIRFFALNALREKFSRPTAVIVSSLIWTLMHWGPTFNIFIGGLFLGYFYVKTESLSLCVLLHFLYNISQGTEIFYVLSNGVGFLAITPAQYFVLIFVILIVFYHFVEFLFGTPNRPSKL